jgi:hypothetical protein
MIAAGIEKNHMLAVNTFDVDAILGASLVLFGNQECFQKCELPAHPHVLDCRHPVKHTRMYATASRPDVFVLNLLACRDRIKKSYESSKTRTSFGRLARIDQVAGQGQSICIMTMQIVEGRYDSTQGPDRDHTVTRAYRKMTLIK